MPLEEVKTPETKIIDPIVLDTPKQVGKTYWVVGPRNTLVPVPSGIVFIGHNQGNQMIIVREQKGLSSGTDGYYIKP